MKKLDKVSEIAKQKINATIKRLEKLKEESGLGEKPKRGKRP